MIYTNYTNRIKNVVEEKRQRQNLEKGIQGFNGSSKDLKNLILEQRSFSNKNQLNYGQPLSNILHPTVLQTAQVGLHPDFKHLKGTDNNEKHYIVSVFIDIAGSTNLFSDYTLEEIFIITNTIQSAAIHTCLTMGGHIQRLQGDGVFAYFGGRKISKESAVELAATACSMITYFVKNDLTDLFLGDEIENIKTRIGIDIGDDQDVLWANFGLLDVSELTTLSLHTSLASKMQSFAKKNGIVVGQNVKNLLKVDEGIFDFVRDTKGEIIKRYVYEDNKKAFRYTQYNFDWFKYLKTLPFINSDADGNLYILTKEEQEKIRAEKLRITAGLIKSSSAFTDSKGNISENNSGVKNHEHRFHYE